MIHRTFVCIVAIALLAGCGQKASTRTGGAVTPAPVASTSGTTASQGDASMDCGGAKPVWVNEKSGVYHYAGDPYYGHTKRGRYMCESDAKKEGDRPSKTGAASTH